MSTRPHTAIAPPMLAPWHLVLLGWLIMYGPTYNDLVRSTWQSEEEAHGGLIFVVVLWLIWEKRHMVFSGARLPRLWSGSLVFLLGLVMYACGRSQSILMLEIGSQIAVLLGVLLVFHGGSAVRALAFPAFYMIFMVPVPSFIVDNATGPLKLWISELVANGLFTAGYPVAHSGVVLTVGQYELLVADACSGLHSMFSLTALGFLYLYLMQRKSWIHNALMVASFLPIAFAANVVRVAVLALITYYLGDEAGRGFLHGFAGILLMLAATVLLLMFDAVLVRILPSTRLSPKAGTAA